MKLSRKNHEKKNGKSKKRKITDGGQDRLSSLPDAILISILSLLPIETVVSTSKLSHRWRSLWTQVTALRFHAEFFHGTYLNSPKFYATVSHVLRHLTSPEIHTFEFHVPAPPRYDYEHQYLPPDRQHIRCHHRKRRRQHMRSSVSLVCDNGVKELRLSVISCRVRALIPLPPCVFMCHSLVVLELGEGFDYELPKDGNISLPKLKKLSIYLCDSHGELMGDLLKSCPLLEELLIEASFDKVGHFVDIPSNTLKKLELGMKGYLPLFKTDAPQLEHVCVRDLYQLKGDEDSIEQRPLHMGTQHFDNGDRALGLAQAISSVRYLDLSDFGAFYYVPDHILPIFHNLVTLRVVLSSRTSMKYLLQFIEYSPNLEVLVLEKRFESEHSWWCLLDSVPSCLQIMVKNVTLSTSVCDEYGLKLIKNILSWSNVLEILNINVASPDGDIQRAVKEIRAFTSSSLFCRINFSGSYLNTSWRTSSHFNV